MFVLEAIINYNKNLTFNELNNPNRHGGIGVNSWPDAPRFIHYFEAVIGKKLMRGKEKRMPGWPEFAILHKFTKKEAALIAADIKHKLAGEFSNEEGTVLYVGKPPFFCHLVMPAFWVQRLLKIFQGKNIIWYGA